MARDTMPTPVSVERSAHDMSLDEWKGLALRCSVQLGRRPGTDGDDDRGAGLARDVYGVVEAVGRKPDPASNDRGYGLAADMAEIKILLGRRPGTNGADDEGTGVARIADEHHRATRSSANRSAGALVAAGASVLVAIAAVLQAYAQTPRAPVSVPAPASIVGAGR